MLSLYRTRALAHTRAGRTRNLAIDPYLPACLQCLFFSFSLFLHRAMVVVVMKIEHVHIDLSIPVTLALERRFAFFSLLYRFFFLPARSLFVS